MSLSSDTTSIEEKVKTDHYKALLSRLTQTTCSLIAIPSVSSNLEECARVISYVEERSKAFPVQARKFLFDGRPSLYIAKDTTRLTPALLLLGHIDVVPAPEELFTPEVRDGWIYGRGAIDMKGPVAVMLEYYFDHCDLPGYEDLALLLTADEEVGGFFGICPLITKEGLRPKVVINPDGGDYLIPCVGEKGIWQIELNVKGKSAHGSRPWLGVNAIDLLMADLKAIKEGFAWSFKDEEYGPTINVGTIQGGEATNSIAAHARATLDIRYPHPEALLEIQEFLKSTPLHSTITPTFTGDPVVVEESDPALSILLDAIEAQEFPRSTLRECGSSDARWFSSLGSHILLTLPNGKEAHAQGEAVEAESLVKFYQVLEHAVPRLLRC